MATTTAVWLTTTALLLTGCQLDDTAASTDQPLPPTAEDSALALDELDIEPEQHEGSYDRSAWPHWTTVNGCDTRARVLKIEAHANEPLETSEDCTVTAGSWDNVFAGEHVMDAPPLTNPDEIEIDHVVSLAEAHRSGGHAWSEDQRREFANHVGMTLIPMSASDNNEKSDQDAAEWMPENECLYATYVVDIKHAYGLSVDQAERQALLDALHTCPGR